MVRAGDGDRDAFAVLVHRHVDALYRYALRLTASPANAEDLVQETWLAAWQNARRFRPERASLATWLHRILHNRFVDTVRKRQPDSDPAALASLLADPGDARDDANTKLTARLNQLIMQLPENQKAALALAHLQGFSNKEVAHILGVRLRAAESLLARARRTLREQLSDDECT